MECFTDKVYLCSFRLQQQMYSNIIALNKSTNVQLIQNAHQLMLKWTHNFTLRT